MYQEGFYWQNSQAMLHPFAVYYRDLSGSWIKKWIKMYGSYSAIPHKKINWCLTDINRCLTNISQF